MERGRSIEDSGVRMRQSKAESLIEQSFNMGSGFIIAWAAWKWLVAPLVDIGVLEIHDAFWITVIFTVISFIRGLIWRRVFEHELHKAVHRFFFRA